jgi:RNA polymerase sigma-70 factor (family 1)
MVDYFELNDADLVSLMKEGNKKAYTVLYDRYKRLMYLHAYKKTGDAQEAQDVLQDVFLNLWSKRDQVSEEENLSGYLYTSIRNRILNLISHKKIRDRYEESLLQFSDMETPVADHLIREKQFSEMIQKEIDALPEKMREIFLLSRKGYLKNKEIAEHLGLSEHTVATQIKRALKILRSRLGLMLYLVFLFFY